MRLRDSRRNAYRELLDAQVSLRAHLSHDVVGASGPLHGFVAAGELVARWPGRPA